MCCTPTPIASPNAQEPIGTLPCPWACEWKRAPAPVLVAHVPDGARVLPLPRPCASLAQAEGLPLVGVGRYEGTETFLGRRDPELAGTALALAADPQYVCGAVPLGHPQMARQTEHVWMGVSDGSQSYQVL